MEMGFRYTQLFALIILVTSMFVVGTANKNLTKGPENWNFGFNYTNGPFGHHNLTRTSRRIIVGGSENWHFGFNYTDWALKNGPFYFNDTLVFKYDPPSGPDSHPHSVYLLPDMWSFLKCDLRRAKRVATTTQGGGEGFEFRLKSWGPHYFACGESNGIHCNVGMMKFFVLPLLRWY
ncbi:hypothetical protein LguiA_008863 [Lonicera macranthoides]